MSYLKCAWTGLAGALIAGLLWILWAFALPILGAVLRQNTSDGADAIMVTIDSSTVLIAAAIGFVAGFAWRWRRLRT